MYYHVISRIHSTKCDVQSKFKINLSYFRSIKKCKWIACQVFHTKYHYQVSAETFENWYANANGYKRTYRYNKTVSMVAHSFPRNSFQYLEDFHPAKLEPSHVVYLTHFFACLPIWYIYKALLRNVKMEYKKARKAFNIRDVKNPVCCHGDKTGNLNC